MNKPDKVTDLKGQMFGRLLVIDFSHIAKDRKAYWHTRCVCGGNKIVRGNAMKTGNNRSCGECFNRNARHGLRTTPIYNIWSRMKQRCCNPNYSGFHNYGGRGIKVCKRWEDSFENFYADMGDRPKSLSIERIDNNANYEPNNCKWATRKEQSSNTRKNVFLTYNGEIMIIAQWERKYGINQGALKYRIKAGWNMHRALTQPLARRANR